MPPASGVPEPRGYEYGYWWTPSVLEHMRRAARALDVSTNSVIHRVLDALDRAGTPDLAGRTTHRKGRLRVVARGDEVLAVHLER